MKNIITLTVLFFLLSCQNDSSSPPNTNNSPLPIPATETPFTGSLEVGLGDTLIYISGEDIGTVTALLTNEVCGEVSDEFGQESTSDVSNTNTVSNKMICRFDVEENADSYQKLINSGIILKD